MGPAGARKRIELHPQRAMPSTPSRRPHPHFDDRGTLDWHTNFDAALAAAAALNKLLFVEFGREA